jgi:uncharacterized protein DUF4190
MTEDPNAQTPRPGGEPPEQPPPPGQPPAPAAAPYAGGLPVARSSGKAVASLVLGIAGLIILPVVCSVLAIIFGQQAKREIDADPTLTGRGMAQAGFILGIIGLAFVVVFVIILIAVGASTS